MCNFSMVAKNVPRTFDELEKNEFDYEVDLKEDLVDLYFQNQSELDQAYRILDKLKLAVPTPEIVDYSVD